MDFNSCARSGAAILGMCLLARLGDAAGPPADRSIDTSANQTDTKGLPSMQAKTPKAQATDQQVHAANPPLAVTPGPDDAVISCEGTMRYDASEGVLVYLDGVRLTDPRFSLTGADELKVFFEKPPSDKTDATDGKTQTAAGLGAKFGRVERIVATGAIRLVRKAAGEKEPQIEAGGAIFSFAPNTGRITLINGYPWVKQGTLNLRAKEPNVTLHIEQSGVLMTEGKWETEIHYFAAEAANRQDNDGSPPE
jgi:hypothetical protein